MATEQTGTLTPDTIHQAIHEQIANNFLFDADSGDLSDSASLPETGVVDATGVLEIVLFVEETFGVAVAETDLVPENFDSVDNITRYVIRQLANM